MKKNIFYISVFLLFTLLSANLFSQNDKDIVYNQLIEKYGDLKSISLQFKSMDNPRVEGSLQAKRGNKYRLEMGSRIITSNAKFIWNYSIDDKNVIVSRFDKGLHSNSIENLFFTFLQDFSPVSLKKENSSKGTSFTILTLKSVNNDENINIESITLWLDQNSNIQSFAIENGKSTEKWSVWNLNTNPNLTDKSFDFRVPKGAELIDLR